MYCEKQEHSGVLKYFGGKDFVQNILVYYQSTSFFFYRLPAYNYLISHLGMMPGNVPMPGMMPGMMVPMQRPMVPGMPPQPMPGLPPGASPQMMQGAAQVPPGLPGVRPVSSALEILQKKTSNFTTVLFFQTVTVLLCGVAW